MDLKHLKLAEKCAEEIANVTDNLEQAATIVIELSKIARKFCELKMEITDEKKLYKEFEKLAEYTANKQEEFEKKWNLEHYKLRSAMAKVISIMIDVYMECLTKKEEPEEDIEKEQEEEFDDVWDSIINSNCDDEE